MSSSNCCFLNCIRISQEAGQVVWYSHPLNFPQFVVIHTDKGFGVVNKAEVDVFLELSCFFLMIQQMLAIWLLGFLPFLNPNWTSGSLRPVASGHCCHRWVFQIFWYIECSTFTASSFRIWNSSTGIPSPPLALFIAMLPKAHLTSHSRISDSRWVTHHRAYLGHEDLLYIALLCTLATSS